MSLLQLGEFTVVAAGIMKIVGVAVMIAFAIAAIVTVAIFDRNNSLSSINRCDCCINLTI